MRTLIAVSLMLLLATPAAAGTLFGVTLPDTVNAGGTNLVLNGMGLRKKAFIKVYVAGLYLPKKMSGASAILAAGGPYAIEMKFMRNVGKDKICDAWHAGLKSNTKNVTEKLKADFNTLCSYTTDAVEGKSYIFTYVPGTGVSANINGVAKGTIAGDDFAKALLRIWLGPVPPGADLKAGLVKG